MKKTALSLVLALAASTAAANEAPAANSAVVASGAAMDTNTMVVGAAVGIITVAALVNILEDDDEAVQEPVTPVQPDPGTTTTTTTNT